MTNLIAVVLAAGKGERMKSDRPKVLHELCGRPMIEYVLDAAREAGAKRILAVVGHGAAEVRTALAAHTDVDFAVQTEQRGTGHAVEICREQLKSHAGPVLILTGDAPLVRGSTLARLLDLQQREQAACAFGTAEVANPFGLGRVVRDERHEFARIVEEKDATPAEKLIREINPSYYVFHGPDLLDSLTKIRPNNQQNQLYLTDCPGVLKQQGKRVIAAKLIEEEEAYGVNSREQLATAYEIMQRRIQTEWMRQGVTIVDPRSTFIDARVTIGVDTVIRPFTYIQGPSTIGARCRIGPFSHIRPGTKLAADVEIGAFVEVNRSQVARGSMARHLAYLGDATVGEDVTIGAGAITANFDGKGKNATAIGDRVLIGAGCVLVAPVSVGTGATVGAGSVVTKGHDVAADSVVVGVPARPLRRSS